RLVKDSPMRAWRRPAGRLCAAQRAPRLYYYCNTASLGLGRPAKGFTPGIGPARRATKYSEVSAAEMRAAMIDSQLRTNDVIDPAVVGAMGAVAREAHVPPALASVAYMDRAVPLGNGRALSAPLVTGRLLVAAMLRPGMRVLLIGAATGYTAACLARLGAEVHAVEAETGLLEMAKAATADDNVHWIAG